MHHILGELERYIGDYGYLAVFLGILLEDFGLPTPGETLLISGAIVASSGKLDIWLLLSLAFIGAVIGDNIGFAIGHTAGHRVVVKYGRHIGITSPRLKKVESFFERYGNAVIIFARFVVVLRQLNGIVAGTLEMHWAHFLLYNAIGAALWVGFWGLLAYYLGREVLVLTDRLHATVPVLVGVAVLVALGFAGHWWWRRRREQRENSAEHP